LSYKNNNKSTKVTRLNDYKTKKDLKNKLKLCFKIEQIIGAQFAWIGNYKIHTILLSKKL